MAIKPPIKYHLAMYLPGMDKNPQGDVSYFSIIRAPISKQASYAMLRINLKPALIQQLINGISDNNFIKANIRLYIIDESKNNKPITPLFDKFYNILRVNTETDLNASKSDVTAATLILVDPVLHNMSCNFTYNKIFESKTCIEIYNDYEKFIEQKYGSCFDTNKIITNENKHIYDQIMINPRNQTVKLDRGNTIQFTYSSDIDVIPWLQTTYKITNAFSVYFFDEFDTSRNKSITRHFLTFYDVTKFPQIDISNQGDVLFQSKKIGTSYVADSGKFLDKDLSNTVFNYRTPDMKTKIMKITSSGNLEQQKTVSNTKLSLTSSRSSNLQNQIFQTASAGQSTTFFNVKVPDTADMAKQRIQLIQDTIKNKIDCLEFYQTTNCSYDWLQFGNSYNMSQDRKGYFLYTPINIINVFSRIHSKEEWLTHHVKYTMVKFRK